MRSTTHLLAAAACSVMCFAGSATAQDNMMGKDDKMAGKMPADGTTEYEVTVTNLTTGQPFSPPIVVAHKPEMHLFEVGKMASAELQKVAEEGMGGDLVKMLAGKATNISAATMDQHVMPGKSLTLKVKAKPGDVISVVNMVAATNDTFTGVDCCPLDEAGMKMMKDKMMAMGDKMGDMKMPEMMMENGACVTMAMAYDAGTEENTEKKSDTAAPDMGKGHPGTSPQQPVMMSKGIMGTGDLDKAKFGWTGPVAKIEIKKAGMMKEKM